MIVDVKSKWSEQVIFDQFAQAGLTVDNPLRSTNNVVPIRKKARYVSRGVRYHIENVPNIVSGCKRSPLESDAERGRRCRYGDMKITYSLTLQSPLVRIDSI